MLAVLIRHDLPAAYEKRPESADTFLDLRCISACNASLTETHAHVRPYSEDSPQFLYMTVKCQEELILLPILQAVCYSHLTLCLLNVITGKSKGD
jgi:hypothetical protein